MHRTSFELTRRFLFQLAMAMGGTAVLPSMALSQNGRVLRIRSDRDIKILDPAFMTGAIEQWVQHTCLFQLANYAPGDTWGWIPGLITDAIEQVDELNIRFRLKPGYQWSNGFGEVTAEDVKYSIDRMHASEWHDKFSVIDRVDIIDDHEGVIVLNTPFAPIWLTTFCDGVGSIVSRKAVEELGTEVDSALADGTKLKRYHAEFPAICGPYAITEWVPNQRVVLGPNPGWIGERPSIEDVVLIVVTDEKAAELGYEAGDLDVTEISVESVPRVQEAMPPDAELLLRAGTRWTWLGMNTEHPKLQDRRIREAICLAVDVDAIVEAAYGGLAPRSHGVVPPGLIGHRETSKYMTPDPERAKVLIAEAGAEGLALDIKIINSSEYVAAASIAQANLADIGIDLEVVPLDPGMWWDLGLESRGDYWKDLQLYIARYGDSPDPSQMTQWYVSSQVGIWNWERWRSEEFDALFQEGLRETDIDRRHEIYVQMQEIMDDTAAYIWITHEPVPILYRSTVEPRFSLHGVPFVPGFKWT